MLPNLPAYTSVLFIVITIITVWLFYRATNHNRTTLMVVLGWLVLQTILSLAGFYQRTDTVPPPLALLIGPPLLLVVSLFITKRGRLFIDSLRLDQLTVLHTIRLVVEIVLFLLYTHKAVPKVMTFEGRNFDILAGLTAPVVYYFGFVRHSLSRRVILLWNFVSLSLLANIVITAVLAAPTPLQQLAFDQPNIAIQYFPFAWLPSVVVPIVLFSHLAAIRQVLTARPTSPFTPI